MEQILVSNYTFDKVAKTITFTDFTTIQLERIQLITDTTNGTILYQFNKVTKGGTVATNVLTLTYDTNTGSFNNTDDLQILYADSSFAALDQVEFLSAVSKGIIGHGVVQDSPDVISDGQTAAYRINSRREQIMAMGSVAVASPDGFEVNLSFTASTSPQLVKAATALKKIYITDIVVSSSAIQTVRFEDDTGTPNIIIPTKFLPANSVYSRMYRLAKQLETNKALNMVCSTGSGTVTVELMGFVI